MPGRRVAITGLSAVTALGSNLKNFWEDLCDGKSGIGPIELFDTAKFKTHFGGEVRNFDPSEYIDAREQKRLDRFAQFALVAATRAVDDSGLDFSREDPTRCGVVIGSGIGGLAQIEEAQRRVVEDPSRLSPLMIPKMIINAAAGHVSIRFGLKGPTSSVATACASASNAIGDAMRLIQNDDADIVLAGGSEAALTPLGLGGFIAMRALSQRNDAPDAASRPFDKDRDGFVLSEGAGILVLEEYERAKARNATIYAELLGYGATSDGLHITAPDPEGKGAAAAMKAALRSARLDPTAIDYVNAHGTGTPLGDVAETVAMKRVFGDHARRLMVSSTKSQLGHLLGASGGVEMVITSLALVNGVAPPTINLDKPDPDCDLDYVPNEARETTIKFAMSNSFGFGGHNASLVAGIVDAAPKRRAA